MNTRNRFFRSRGKTAFLGYGFAIALAIGAGVLAKSLPRRTADSLYPLLVGLVLVALSAVAATTVSLLFRKRSSLFLVGLFVVCVVVAVLARVIVGDVSDEPVIFSASILTPIGTAFAAGIAIVLTARVVASRSARK